MKLTKSINTERNGIIIPCYNEANRLDLNAFRKFANKNPDYIICFVNDGSNDDTLVMLKNFAATIQNVKVYDMPHNGGKAEAVRQGMNHMLKTTRVLTLGFLDADLSTDFLDYKNLITKFSKDNSLECVFGSRKLGIERTIERSLFRDVASNIVGSLIKSVLRLPIQDTQCGAKIFTRKIANLCFSRSFTTRWLFDVEIFLKLKKAYGSIGIMSIIQEVPLKRWVHVEGSKISVKDSLKIPGMLFKIIMDYKVQPYLSSSNVQINNLYSVLEPKAA